MGEIISYQFTDNAKVTGRFFIDLFVEGGLGS